MEGEGRENGRESEGEEGGMVGVGDRREGEKVGALARAMRVERSSASVG